MSDLILNRYVDLHNVKTDKYGRLLCEVYYGGLSVNVWLLNNNLAT